MVIQNLVNSRIIVVDYEDDPMTDETKEFFNNVKFAVLDIFIEDKKSFEFDVIVLFLVVACY